MLGPFVIFNLYKRLTTDTKECIPSIFADDTEIMTSSFDITDLQRQLLEDIGLVMRWMADNELTMNILKIDFVVIASAAKMKGVQETFHVIVKINGFTGPHLLNLWDFTFMKISIGESSPCY